MHVSANIFSTTEVSRELSDSSLSSDPGTLLIQCCNHRIYLYEGLEAYPANDALHVERILMWHLREQMLKGESIDF
jgi:hypothetical protein